MLSGSKPISLAATASIATWSAEARMTFLTIGLHQARAGAVAGRRAVHHGEDARVDLLLDRQQVHQRLVDPGVGVVPVLAEQPAEGVLHRAGGRRVHVRLDRRQVHDVLADEVIRDADALRVDVIQGQHLRLGLVGHPGHVFLAEVVQHRDAVVPEDRHVAVQVLALEGVGDHGLVLHADQVVEPGCAQRQDRAFELPGRGVGAAASGSARRCCPSGSSSCRTPAPAAPPASSNSRA